MPDTVHTELEEVTTGLQGTLELLKSSVSLLEKTVGGLMNHAAVTDKKENVSLTAAIAQAQETSLEMANQNRKIDEMMKYFLDEDGVMTPLSKIIDRKFAVLVTMHNELPCRAAKRAK